MSQFTNEMERMLIDFIFRDFSMVKPSTLAIALSSGIPSDASTAADMWELGNVGSYARQSLNASSTNWSRDSTFSGTTYNNSAIAFPTATADWGWVSGVMICNSATYGGGSGFFWGSLATAKRIESGDSLTIPISGISVRLD
jgi:hypothetical protein